MLNCDLELINPGLDALFHSRDLVEIQALIERASKAGIATRDIRLQFKDRTLYCAVTVSALDSESSSSQGYVMVLEDLTELLKAQKANAWREVARRMAHEIKNPLTPIQLSADRLLKNYFKRADELSATQARGMDLKPSCANVFRPFTTRWRASKEWLTNSRDSRGCLRPAWFQPT